MSLHCHQRENLTDAAFRDSNSAFSLTPINHAYNIHVLPSTNSVVCMWCWVLQFLCMYFMYVAMCQACTSVHTYVSWKMHFWTTASSKPRPFQNLCSWVGSKVVHSYSLLLRHSKRIRKDRLFVQKSESEQRPDKIYRGGPEGTMITCKNEDCTIEWFHMTALWRLEKSPWGSNWYCPDCRRLQCSLKSKYKHALIYERHTNDELLSLSCVCSNVH